MQNNAGHFPHANVENRAPGIFRTIVDEKGLCTLIVAHDKAFVFKDVGQCIVNIGIVVDDADNRSGGHLLGSFGSFGRDCADSAAGS